MLTLCFAFPHDLADLALEARCDALLPAAEQARCHSYRFPRDRHRALAARVLLRSALSCLEPSIAFGEWRFEARRHGKLFLASPSRFRFNLAHVPDLAACLLSDSAEVGVDIEPYARAASILPLSPRLFSGAELDQLAALDPALQPDRALSLWTLKEAYTKARGKSLDLPLNRFSFLFLDSGHIRLEIDGPLKDSPSRWQFTLLDLAAHRIALIAEASAGRDLTVLQFRPLLSPPRPLELPAPRWFPAA
jgi:4'-phosphopantetheinyl transferase